MELCAFCETAKATHFNLDWDALLCNECADAQDAGETIADLPQSWQDIINERKEADNGS